MKEQLQTIKNTLRKEKQEMRVATLLMQGKELLKEVRKLIIDLGYTEAKLIYRNGAYLMTVVLDNVSKSDLELMGFNQPKTNEEVVA